MAARGARFLKPTKITRTLAPIKAHLRSGGTITLLAKMIVGKARSPARQSWVIVEVLLAFVTMHLCFKAVKQLTALGAHERAAGLNFTPGIVMAAAAILFIAIGRRKWESYGFVWPHLSQACRWRLVLPALYAVSLVVFLAGHAGGSQNGALVFLGLVSSTAIGEELFFRGYMQSRLNEVFGLPGRIGSVRVGLGLLVSSLFFGVLHGLNTVDYFRGHYAFAWGWTILTVASGFLFGMIREKTGSVVPGIIAHGLLDVWILALVMRTRG